MDLARDKYGFLTGALPSGSGAVPAGAALTGEIARDLIGDPDTPRAALASALQETTRQLESLLSCVSGTFYRCELSPPWRMDFISASIEAVSGYTPEDFAELPFGALIDPEDLPELTRTIDAAIADRSQFNMTYRIRHRSGETRWISERGTAVYDAEGRPQFLEGFLTDVTAARDLEIEAERTRTENEELNRRMSRILECTLDGISSLDQNWNYRFVNQAGSHYFGDTRDLLGRNVRDVIPGIDKTSAWPILVDAMENRQARRAECYSERTKNWYEVYAVPDISGITAFFRDITDRKRLETALFDQAAELRGTLDSIPDMIWTTAPNGSGDYYNKSWNDFVGETRNDPADRGWPAPARWLHPDDRDSCYAHWNAALEIGQPFEIELRIRHHSGEYRWVHARSWPQRDEQGSIIKWCGSAADVHERVLAEQHLRESENLQSNILDASTDSIQILDLEGHLLFVNDAGIRTAGLHGRMDCIGRHWSEICPEPSWPLASQALRRATRGEVTRFVESSRGTTGKTQWWDVIVSPIRDTDGKVSKVLCTARDISDQRRTADRLRVASEQDFLTGLPNRRAFEKHLKKVTLRARDLDGNVGLLLIDLDHFKHVNDTLGHLAGDHLLQAIAKRVKGCVGNSGFVARLGGDEFAIVLNQVRCEEDLIEVADQVLSRMEAPVTYLGKLINGGLSIGCAMFPRDADDAHGLLKHADTALYDLKASGRGGTQMFNNRMMEAAERTASQLALARSAIRDDAVEPYYQPKIRLETGEITGFEALLRWWSPGIGIQPPSAVAEAFNDYELSTRIGGLMQSRIFADMASWLERGLDLRPVSINAAPAEFLRDDYAERLLDRMAEFRIPAGLIEVEITEHVFIERRPEHVVRALELLKSAGARIALDDFGTGHSSLSHLRDFPVDVLKIDRSFVSRMLTKPRMLAIVQAITKLGPSLSLDIVAEGVETPDQLHALREAGCEFGQGYLFGKAMHPAEVARRLVTENWPFKLQIAS